MKKLVMCLLIMVMCVSAYGGAWDAQDEEANKVAQSVRSLLGGKAYDKSVLEAYEGAYEVVWSGRGIHTGSVSRITYLISCEIKFRRSSSMFIYYEIKLASVNDIPALIEKYGLN